MGYSIAQWLGAMVLFAAAVVMVSLIPSVWGGLNNISAASPELLSPDLLAAIKVFYGTIVAGFIGGSISLLLLGR